MKERNDTERQVAKRSATLTVQSRVEKRRSPRLPRSSHPTTSTAASSQYMWTPVDKHRKGIRLLDLDAGVGHSPLRGHLRHVFMDSLLKPEYETISYVWGDTALVEKCLVGDKSIPIPASAGSALRCMRLPDANRTLWIDCICIDQSNDREKGHQVGLMADIFQSSRRTLAHLGDNDDDTAERAFDGLATVCDAWLESARDKQMPDGTYGRIEDRKIQDWSSLRETIDLLAIKAIMAKPYFKRLWVVQEAVLSAKTILCCGTWSIDMHRFVFAATWLMFGPPSFENEIYNGSHLKDARSFLDVVHAALLSSRDELSLTWILHRSTLLQCSEPRDRVFGLLGLLKLFKKRRPSPAILAPDYTKSVADVYCDATRACIGECDGPWLLDMFGYERGSDNKIADLPTWVPNWYAQSDGATVLPTDEALWAHKREATETPLVSATQTGKVLSIRGVVLDTISKHSDASITTDIRTSYAFITNALQLLSNEEMPVGIESIGRERLGELEHVLGAGRPDASVIRRWLKFVRFLTPDQEPLTNEVLGLTTQSPEPSGLHDTQDEDLAGSPPEAQDTILGTGKSFQRAVEYCYARKVFMTQSGRLGIGPEALRDGDIIAVSKLSQWPMVLRHAENSEPDHYTVVGAAYIEDIRSGEEILTAADEGDGIGTMHLV